MLSTHRDSESYTHVLDSHHAVPILHAGLMVHDPHLMSAVHLGPDTVNKELNE